MNDLLTTLGFLDAKWVLLALLLCSIIATAIIVERLLFGPTKEKLFPTEYQKELKRLLQLRKYDELVGVSRSSKSSLARFSLRALELRNRSKSELKEALLSFGDRELVRLQKNLSALSTIASVSPLLGLLGTVVGMIKTFAVIQASGSPDSAVLAGGISEALLTTAAGLTIAIPCLLFHRYFTTKLKRLLADLDSIVFDVVELIYQGEE
ncbi:UNVERIFIED_CONTAM: hypothetical protein GTU68_024286 [Idotea baltica]|nr:hypothetical protein [Idotea baltica]